MSLSRSSRLPAQCLSSQRCSAQFQMGRNGALERRRASGVTPNPPAPVPKRESPLNRELLVCVLARQAQNSRVSTSTEVDS
jgi:hypothetical protein